MVIGGGFAGVEAAWQAAQEGARVRLYEMRPVQADARAPHGQTGGDRLLELAEVRRAGDRAVSSEGGVRRGGLARPRCGDANDVPAGAALAVDRHSSPKPSPSASSAHPNIDARPRRGDACCEDESRSSPPGRSAPTRWPRRSRGSPGDGRSTSTTPSRPSSRRIPSTPRSPSARRATGRAATTTSTARCTRRSTRASTTRSSARRASRSNGSRRRAGSRRVCRLRRWRGAASTRCATGR